MGLKIMNTVRNGAMKKATALKMDYCKQIWNRMIGYNGIG